jgi:hypothetical protein
VRARPEDPPRSGRAGAERAVYLYCFARADRLDPLAPPLLAVREGAVAAVAKEVPLADFAGPGAEERARDLAWVGPRALEHNRVVERVGERSPVFPVPFATLYSSEQALRRFVRLHEGAIGTFLARVDGAAEWAVKGFLDRERAGEALRSRRETEPAATPGARYLQERRSRREGDRELARWLAAAAAEAEDALSRLALELRERPALETQDEPGRQMVFNLAWLVEDGRAGAFASAAEELNSRFEPLGLALRVSGPLPPYSFVPPLAEPQADGEGRP